MISIVIPTYNRPEKLSRTVISILKYIDNNFEIIVVADEVESDRYDFLKDKVTVLYNGKNRGAAYSRNSGGNATKGDIIYFVDDDIEITDNIFTVSNDVLSTCDGIVATVKSIREDGKKSLLNEYLNISGAAKQENNDILQANYFTTAFCAVKREVFEKVGGFSESFTGYGWEDTEFGIRLNKAGATVKVIKTNNILHYHDKTLDDWCNQLYNSAGNYMELLDKYPDYKDDLGYNFFKSFKAKFLFYKPFLKLYKYGSLLPIFISKYFFKLLFAGMLFQGVKDLKDYKKY